MKQTLLRQAINNGLEQGHVFIGTVPSGLYSTRKGSNIRKFLDARNIDCNDAIILQGARAGKNRNDGYQWAIFTHREAANNDTL